MRSAAACILAIAACGKGHPPSGLGPDADPCGGRGCYSATGPITLTVLDGSTHAPITVQPTFTAAIYSGPIPIQCTAMTTPCPSWQIGPGIFGPGSADIGVAATGYASQQITVIAQGPVGCCGVGPVASATVTLSP